MAFFEKEGYDPLVRTSKFFGGLINDLKRRYSFYLSDFTDGFDLQVLAATIYIYMAGLTSTVAFGGLLGMFNFDLFHDTRWRQQVW